MREHDPELFERVKAGTLAAPRAARRCAGSAATRAFLPPPPLPRGPFDVVYADPPWQLGNPDGPYAPENHYPTLPLAEIKALAVPAAEDALLFLWAVNCLLPEALEVMAAWGFDVPDEPRAGSSPRSASGAGRATDTSCCSSGARGNFPPPDLEDLPTR